MRMLQIEVLPNGGHRNQTYNEILPEGWAIIPDDMTLENFPFGQVTVEEIEGIQTVVGWIPGVVPEPEPEPEPPEPETDIWRELDNAYQEGVDSV